MAASNFNSSGEGGIESIIETFGSLRYELSRVPPHCIRYKTAFKIPNPEDGCEEKVDKNKEEGEDDDLGNESDDQDPSDDEHEIQDEYQEPPYEVQPAMEQALSVNLDEVYEPALWEPRLVFAYPINPNYRHDRLVYLDVIFRAVEQMEYVEQKLASIRWEKPDWQCFERGEEKWWKSYIEGPGEEVMTVALINRDSIERAAGAPQYDYLLAPGDLNPKPRSPEDSPMAESSAGMAAMSSWQYAREGYEIGRVPPLCIRYTCLYEVPTPEDVDEDDGLQKVLDEEEEEEERPRRSKEEHGGRKSEIDDGDGERTWDAPHFEVHEAMAEAFSNLWDELQDRHLWGEDGSASDVVIAYPTNPGYDFDSNVYIDVMFQTTEQLKYAARKFRKIPWSPPPPSFFLGGQRHSRRYHESYEMLMEVDVINRASTEMILDE